MISTAKKTKRFTGEINFRLIYVTENETLMHMVKEAMEENNLERTLVVPCIKGKADVCSDADRFFKAGIPVAQCYRTADLPDGSGGYAEDNRSRSTSGRDKNLA